MKWLFLARERQPSPFTTLPPPPPPPPRIFPTPPRPPRTGNHTYPGQLQIMLNQAFPGKYSVTNLGACGSTMLKKSNSPYWARPQFKALNEVGKQIDRGKFVVRVCVCRSGGISMLRRGEAVRSLQPTEWPSASRVVIDRGISFLRICSVLSQGKWDIIIIMLGTNDAKDPGSHGPNNWLHNCGGPDHTTLNGWYVVNSGYGWLVKQQAVLVVSMHPCLVEQACCRLYCCAPFCACRRSPSADSFALARLRSLDPIACSTFADDYLSMIKLVKTLGTTAAGPKIFTAIPPPLMAKDSIGANQTVINSVYPKLVPLINAAGDIGTEVRFMPALLRCSSSSSGGCTS